jgi:hypothetical protein
VYGEEVVDSIVDAPANSGAPPVITGVTYRMCFNVTFADPAAAAAATSDIFYFSHDSVLHGTPRPGQLLHLELEPLYAGST